MNVLYYCREYFVRYGARTHAREFFAALQKHERVSAAKVIGGAQEDVGFNDKDQFGRQRPQSRFFSALDRYKRVVRYLIPKKVLTDLLIEAARDFQCDVIIARLGGIHNPDYRRVRKALPNVSLCFEINAAHFDEAYSQFWLRNTLQRLEVRNFEIADSVTVVSTYLRDYLVERGMAKAKILVNHNGVDADLFRPKELDPESRPILQKIPDNAFVLGYVGGMEAFRRLPLLIRQVAELRQSGYEDLFLLIVGSGRDEAVIDQAIAEQGTALQDSVLRTGWISHHIVPSLLTRVNVALFPYTNPYCSPLKLFEYLGAGLACIGPDTPAVREVFTHNVHLLLAAQDGSNFKQHVIDLHADPGRARAIATRGQELVLSKYTWRENVNRVLSHIEQIASLQHPRDFGSKKHESGAT